MHQNQHKSNYGMYCSVHCQPFIPLHKTTLWGGLHCNGDGYNRIKILTFLLLKGSDMTTIDINYCDAVMVGIHSYIHTNIHTSTAIMNKHIVHQRQMNK